MSVTETPDVQLGKMEKPALGLGIAAALGLVILGVLDSDPQHLQFFRSYLFGYVFWISFPLGSLALLMLHHLSGGGWGYVIRRLCEASSRTFLLMALLFLPLFFGISRLYKWANPGWAGAAHSQFKAMYLMPGFFRGRAVLYFAVWIFLGYLLSKWSLEQDRTGDGAISGRMEALSAPGLILFGLTTTFAVVDWVMSLEPEWTSTMYGLIFLVIQVFTALAFSIVVARRFAEHEPLASVGSSSRFHDLGTLLFAFTMLWAYLSFSQFLIIWSGNLKSEIPWYMHRVMGEWAGVAAFLLVFHFFIPFLILLNRPLKRRKHMLAVVAGALILISMVDIFWLIMPAFFPTAAMSAMDFLAALLAATAIGGFWLWAFAREVRGRPLVPLHDPNLEEAVEHGA